MKVKHLIKIIEYNYDENVKNILNVENLNVDWNLESELTDFI